MKTLWLFLLLLLQLSTSAQEKYNKVITGKLPLKMFSTHGELQKWFVKEYSSYTPDKQLLRNLKNHLAGKNIVVVLGTWCSDSQREFPRLMKVLDQIHFPLTDLHVYGVDRKKSTPDKIVARYKITNVPTIMVFDKDGTERGRITEEVKKSIESDLESILK